MKITLLVLAILCSGCAGQRLGGVMYQVRRFHDDSMAVTCWTTSGGHSGISCLPDWYVHQRGQ